MKSILKLKNFFIWIFSNWLVSSLLISILVGSVAYLAKSEDTIAITIVCFMLSYLFYAIYIWVKHL